MTRENYNAYMRRYYQQNREKLASAARAKNTPERTRNSNLRRKYGITSDKYDAMLAAQENKCAICKRDATMFRRRLHVDHSHVTGNVRALLCHYCNLMLGAAQDVPSRLIAASEYLRSF